MKHKTWFRLVIKAIGILLLAFSLPHVIWIAGTSLVVQILNASPAQSSSMFYYGQWEYILPQLIPQGLEAAFGFYLLFGGKWIVNKCIPSNRLYCPECGYDISKCRSQNCPECGVRLAFPQQPEPPP